MAANSSNFQVNIKPYKTPQLSDSSSNVEFETEYVTNMLEFTKVIIENEVSIINECELKGHRVTSAEIELELIFMLRYFLNVNMNLKFLTSQTDDILQNFVNEATNFNFATLDRLKFNAIGKNN